MVLNHASLPESCTQDSAGQLRDLIIGMTKLVDSQVVQKSLGIFEQGQARYFQVLWPTLNELSTLGAREESLFFHKLTTKAPILNHVDEGVKDRFLGCESIIFPQDDGAPLVLCAIINGVAVGLPTSDSWDRDSIEVKFKEISDAGSIEEVSEQVDNLARSCHAQSIIDRYGEALLSCSTPMTLWEERETIFPFSSLRPRRGK